VAILIYVKVEEVLIKGAPLGVRTLDPTDLQYFGDYTNLDGTEYKTAGGFNYHNGPEWVWPLGYFLESKLHFYRHATPPVGESPIGHMVHKFLHHHRVVIATSHFRGLPELTNSAGAHCSASCEVQAWSSATILSALHHLHLHQ
jgi:glycogen debranching enzyme